MKASLQQQPMYCSRDHNYPSRLNQQYEKSTQYCLFYYMKFGLHNTCLVFCWFIQISSWWNFLAFAFAHGISYLSIVILALDCSGLSLGSLSLISNACITFCPVSFLSISILFIDSLLCIFGRFVYMFIHLVVCMLSVAFHSLSPQVKVDIGENVMCHMVLVLIFLVFATLIL